MDVLVCSKCLAPMRSVERNGVIIDRCEGCGGIHLDKGELEQLIRAENAYLDRQPRHKRDDDDIDSYARDYHKKRRKRAKKAKKMKGFLEELFDF